MATNIDTGLTAQGATRGTGQAHIFTMSDGNEVVVYYNGTAWGYRIKNAGTWGARTGLTSSPNVPSGQFVQNGNIVYGAIPGVWAYKLSYSTSTHTITMSSSTSGDGNTVVPLAAYWDGTNSRLVTFPFLPNAGVWVYSWAGSNLGLFIEQMTANSPPAGNAGTTDETTWIAVGDGTSTFYVAWCSGSSFLVNKIVSGTNATGTTETAETGMVNLAASCTGLDAIYDGTNIIFVANENNAKLRYASRTGTNTYSSWTDILSDTLSGQPSMSCKGTSASRDLAVLYRSNGSQANGEVYKVQRISGTWESSGTLVAGGASTGWAYPNSNTSDLNGTSGTVPVLYVTGTASTWTLAEDSITIAGGAAAATSLVWAGSRDLHRIPHLIGR